MGSVPRDEVNPTTSRLMGRHYRYVIRSIASGVQNREIAKHCNVQPHAITMFKKRHAREIDEMRDRLDEEFAGLWIADKEKRLGELQELIDILDTAYAQFPDAEYARAKATLLKQASEELGQLPPRQQVVSAHVNHTIEGFTSDDLEKLLT